MASVDIGAFSPQVLTHLDHVEGETADSFQLTIIRATRLKARIHLGPDQFMEE